MNSSRWSAASSQQVPRCAQCGRPVWGADETLCPQCEETAARLAEIGHCNVEGCTNLTFGTDRCNDCRGQIEALDRMAALRDERQARRRREWEQAGVKLRKVWAWLMRVDWETAVLILLVICGASALAFRCGVEWFGFGQ